MGRVLFLDPFSGIAGDMLVAALLHLGGDLDALRRALGALPLTGYRIGAEPVVRGAFAATWFHVRPVDGAHFDAHDHGHDHVHSSAHSHDHVHDSAPRLRPLGQVPALPPLDEPEWAGQPDRSWRTIRAMLQAAALPARARDRAIRVFQRLAEAEGRVHGMPADDVHFHEVGAIDSIVDIVGACLLLEQLDVSRIVCGPLPMGSGRIRTAHGWIPLPAPATVEVLCGFPVREGPPDRELCTPTGAAIVAALAEPGPLPAMTIEGVGYGAGTRDPPDLANVLRAVLGRATASDSPLDVEVIEANLDDLPGEHVPALIEALLAAGALDAFVASVLMKKGRPGLWVQALAVPSAAAEVEAALLRHGSSFGVRRSSARRRVLARHHVRVATPWGEVRVKVGELDGERLHASPEYEDVRAIAQSAGVPVPRVHAAAVAAFAREDAP